MVFMIMKQAHNQWMVCLPSLPCSLPAAPPAWAHLPAYVPQAVCGTAAAVDEHAAVEVHCCCCSAHAGRQILRHVGDAAVVLLWHLQSVPGSGGHPANHAHPAWDDVVRVETSASLDRSQLAEAWAEASGAVLHAVPAALCAGPDAVA